MKRVFSFTLTIALLFSMLCVFSLPASAETELPADIPEDNEMYAEGKRQVMIYRFAL